MLDAGSDKRNDPNGDIADILRQALLEDEYENESDRTGHLLMLMAMDSQFGTKHIDTLVKVVHDFTVRAQLRESRLRKSIEIAQVMRVGLLDREYNELSDETIQEYDNQQTAVTDARRERLQELRQQRAERLRARERKQDEDKSVVHRGDEIARHSR